MYVNSKSDRNEEGKKAQSCVLQGKGTYHLWLYNGQDILHEVTKLSADHVKTYTHKIRDDNTLLGYYITSIHNARHDADLHN